MRSKGFSQYLKKRDAKAAVKDASKKLKELAQDEDAYLEKDAAFWGN